MGLGRPVEATSWRALETRLRGTLLSSGNVKPLEDFIRGRTGSDLCFKKITLQHGRQIEGQKVPETAEGPVRRLNSKLGHSSSWDDEMSRFLRSLGEASRVTY